MSKRRFAGQTRVALPGSEKPPVSRLSPLIAEHANPAARGAVRVTMILRSKRALDTRTRLSRSLYARTYGPDPTSLKLVKAFATEYGLTVAATPTGGHCRMILAGSESKMQAAFGVTLQHTNVNGVACRVRDGAIYLPEELSGHVTAVLGLDNRPQAKPHFRVATPHATNISYTPVQVGSLYGVSAGASAAGQTIGLIELGGGFRAADIKAYFASLGVAAPTVTAFAVDGGKNTPSTPSGADGEVMLDIEVAGAIAVGAKIVVYFAPNTDQGFIDAISTAVHDTANKPGVISISWGGPESSWTQQATTALDAACQAAAVLGVTISVAAGDNGSSDGVTDGSNQVDFPASSPHVLACGGTKLVGSGTSISSEVVWNETAVGEGATGGGVSNVFALPAFQAKARVPAPSAAVGGRGVPDVAGDADPSTGYSIRVDGQTMVIGGTSAVAPLWAGLVALANAQSGTTAGFVNPALYAATGAFRDITSGNNGAFSAGPGWDACTGLGSPLVSGLLQLLVKPAKKPRKPKKPKKKTTAS